MLPPKKKRKIDEDTDAVMTDASAPAVPSLADLDNMLDKFVDSLEDISSASSTLLQVKDFQRTVLHQLEETNDQLSDKQAQIEKHRTTMANLQYEQGHWESKIAHLQNSSKTPQLEALCREELDDNLSDQSKVLEKFLGQDICDANHQQQKVVAILHQQINARGTLERDLSQRNKEWLNLSNIQKKRSQFLQQLPDKLKDMEKASLPLQRFFAAASRGKTADPDPPISTAKYNTTSDRDARLQLAQQLAGPLYTLFVQLQAYLDDYPEKNMSLDVGNISSVVKNNSESSSSDTTIWKDPAPHVVLWQVPVPPLQSTASSSSSSKPKYLTVAFTYFDAYQVVTAKVINGGEDKLDLIHVLQLNPQDTGGFQVQKQEPPQDSKGEEETSKEEPESITPIYGKPYLWCNYLAGLQILGDKPIGDTKLHGSSTRVIVAEFSRNLKANATLYYILHKLLPSYPRASALPPTSNASTSCLAKLSSFQLVPPTAPTTFKTYNLVCKRGNHSLSMTVQLDPTLYPVLSPPVWSLTGNTLEWGQEHGTVEGLEGGANAPPLHQSRLAAMEARVNDVDGLIETLLNTKEDGKEAEDESFYYDWILTLQLREIMVEWEEWVTNDADSSTVRAVRGRDRAKVE